MGIRAWLKSKFVKRLPEGEEIPKTTDNTREEFMDRIKVGDNGKAPETKDKNGHIKVNEMISYGFAGKCVHLHLPVDLKEDLHTLGVRQTIDKVNLYLVDAIEKISKEPLIYHSAFKKNSYINEEGKEIIPEEPNSYKFEAFIFDSFEIFDDIAILRGKREDDFAPVKNKEGVDSPKTAKELYEKYWERQK